MLALKLTLVPSFLLIVSMSGKWWGPAVAGWLAGLPVVAGPILYLLVLQHGPSFGAHAATLSLAAILASEAFNFGYAWTCGVAHWRVALAAGLAAWFACANALALLPISSGAFAWSAWYASTAWALGAAALGVGFGNAFLPRSRAAAIGAPLTRIDLAGRMLAGIALTLIVTALSGRLGAGWSGVLAVFPLMGVVLSVSSHRAHGPAFVIALLRGMVAGRFSFGAFCLVLSFALTREPALPAFAQAAALAICVQALTKRLAQSRASRFTHVERHASERHQN
ncbi:hypothetical protein QYH69_07545 [Paraburkholderia sp. SARCC-3016]|uniref:hypothetical protein n=1 Tax=Paraburkholderia sp. SARCC-3016 TaxID=3058611 RepID=UPI002807B8FC|nr:hypothetical protein [Paraburkholderia sp. SARCC-3016]MDQ7977098.1 hypothetical protein [Paraburkholderia sp. SARCC-3016]